MGSRELPGHSLRLMRIESRRALLQSLQRYSWLLWIAVTVVAGGILWDRLRLIDLSAIAHRVLTTPAATLCTAILCCLGVYLLSAAYEGIAVHSVSGRRSWLHPGVVASVANPIGHMVGSAILGSSALRYRLHSAAGLSKMQIGGIVVLTAMPFLLGVGWMIDLALVMYAHEAGRALHVAVPTLTLLGSIGLAKDAGWLWLVRTRTTPLHIAGYNVPLPTLGATLIQTAIGLGEILLVAAILYVLLPSTGVSLLTFVAIYLIAVMVGQLSHVPAGLGVFEASLLLMLPQVPPEQLLGAVLLYRAIYELLPLFAALTLLFAHEALARRHRARRTAPQSGRSME